MTLIDPFAKPKSPDQKVALVDTNKLLPLPKHLWNSACFVCDKRQSSWQVVEGQDSKPICAICFLFNSAWGREWHRQVWQMIEDVEKETRGQFLRDSRGRLLSVKDANNILAGIAIVSRKVDIMRSDEIIGNPEPDEAG